MSKPKKITIVLEKREGNTSPYLKYQSKNLERYEIVGILELCLLELKENCLQDTKKRFDN